MPIEEILINLTTALSRVADNQDKLLLGQEQAIKRAESTKPTGKRETKAEKEAREKAEAAAAGPTGTEGEITETVTTTTDAGKAEPANTASGATDAGAAASDEPTDEQLKATAVAWVGAAGEDTAEKKVRADFLQEMARALVGETDKTKLLKLTGAESPLTGAHRKKAVFFIKRAHKLKGTQHVDFAAPYDFDGEHTQDVARVEPAAAAEPEFDPLG